MISRGVQGLLSRGRTIWRASIEYGRYIEIVHAFAFKNFVELYVQTHVMRVMLAQGYIGPSQLRESRCRNVGMCQNAAGRLSHQRQYLGGMKNLWFWHIPELNI